AEFDIMFGEGISHAGEVLDLAVELDIIKKAGSWFSYGGSKLGQGRDTVKNILRDNPELMQEVETKVLIEKGIIEEEVKPSSNGKAKKEKKEAEA
ncbi:MAG: DNA recombination/repair protein RecA, partial [Bacteroidota bacterium]